MQCRIGVAALSVQTHHLGTWREAGRISWRIYSGRICCTMDINASIFSRVK